MSTVFESAINSFLDKNGVGTARALEIKPLGLNAQKGREQTLLAQGRERRTI